MEKWNEEREESNFLACLVYPLACAGITHHDRKGTCRCAGSHRRCHCVSEQMALITCHISYSIDGCATIIILRTLFDGNNHILYSLPCQFLPYSLENLLSTRAIDAALASSQVVPITTLLCSTVQWNVFAQRNQYSNSVFESFKLWTLSKDEKCPKVVWQQSNLISTKPTLSFFDGKTLFVVVVHIKRNFRCIPAIRLFRNVQLGDWTEQIKNGILSNSKQLQTILCCSNKQQTIGNALCWERIGI